MVAAKPPGDRIGHYEVETELGGGAMGVVYRARDTRMFDRQVAIKILAEKLAGTQIALSRFRLEVEVAAKLTHPNIVTIFDQGVHDGRPYFVMEYLEGFDLAQLIRKPELRRFDDKLRIAIQICEGLDYAHTQGVVHRDLKPANVMITQRAGRDEAKLVDFGIVHVDDSGLTRDGAQPGTFNYMAPEQLAGGSAAAVSSRSDLFSLGIVLCELFSGAHPFRGQTDVLTANRILTGDRESVSAKLPEEAAGLEPVLLRLLEQEPARRPERAAAVSVVLQGVLLPIQAADTDPAVSGRVVSGPAPAEPISVDREIETARSDLEIGRLDEARQVLVQALKRDATDPRVQRMLDRILQISERQIPCSDYFHALKAARAALEHGEVDAARKECECAAVLWEDDYEWREVLSHVDAAAAKTAEAATRPVEAPRESPAETGPRRPETRDAGTVAFDDELPGEPRRRPARDDASPQRRRRSPLVFGIAAAASIVVLALGGWWLLGQPSETPVEAAVTRPQAAAEIPPPSPGSPDVEELEDHPTAAEPPVDVARATPVEGETPRPAEVTPAPTSTPVSTPVSGSLRVTSDPASAEVFIDGNYRGRTPLETTLVEGEHPVRLELTGHDPWDRTVRVDARGTPDVTARLVRREPRTTDAARIETPPAPPQREEPVVAPVENEIAETVVPPVSGEAADTAQTEPPPTRSVGLTVVGLWARAEQQRDEEAYGALAGTLDQLLALEADHETALKWHGRMDKWLAERADEWQDNLEELLEDFRAYIADRELDNLEEQWGDAMDGETRAYFVSLFGDYQGAVRAQVDDVEVQPDDDGSGFTATVRVMAKPTRGLRIDYVEVGSYLWRGRVEEIDGDFVFTRPFP